MLRMVPQTMANRSDNGTLAVIQTVENKIPERLQQAMVNAFKIFI
jgi:hypothetical protein